MIAYNRSGARQLHMVTPENRGLWVFLGMDLGLGGQNWGQPHLSHVRFNVRCLTLINSMKSGC